MPIERGRARYRDAEIPRIGKNPGRPLNRPRPGRNFRITYARGVGRSELHNTRHRAHAATRACTHERTPCRCARCRRDRSSCPTGRLRPNDRPMMPPCTLPPARSLSAPLVPPLSVVRREFLEIKFPRLTVLFFASLSRFLLCCYFFFCCSCFVVSLLLVVFLFYSRNTLRTPVHGPISTANNESSAERVQANSLLELRRIRGETRSTEITGLIARRNSRSRIS